VCRVFASQRRALKREMDAKDVALKSDGMAISKVNETERTEEKEHVGGRE